MATIRVHFDGKVFVPDEPVDLPASTQGETHVGASAPGQGRAADKVLNVLAERYASGDKDAAARHNEHQP